MSTQESNRELEQQLRNMLLGNVQMSSPRRPAATAHGRNQGQSNYYQQSPGPRYGGNAYYNNQRGSERGYQGRGRGYGNHQQHSHPNSAPFEQSMIDPGGPPTHNSQYFQANARGRPATTAPHGSPGFQRDRGGYPQQHQASGQYGRGRPAPGTQLWTGGAPRQAPPYQSNRNGAGTLDTRASYLDSLVASEIPIIEMTIDELAEKNAFREQLQAIFTSVTEAEKSPQSPSMSLQNFGSLKSGFATKGSDMDLVIVDSDMSGSTEPAAISLTEHGLPRRFEKALLARGIGARLLTRARVPIIKICQDPSPELLTALKEARDKWDALPEDEKLDDGRDRKKAEVADVPEPQQVQGAVSEAVDVPASKLGLTLADSDQHTKKPVATVSDHQQPEIPATPQRTGGVAGQSSQHPKGQTPKKRDPFTREKRKGPLDFPKDGVGIQCDINFFNPLGIHNTHMLACYSLCDPRVRPMILFVKAWARKRKINSPYSGTLSSYGYVLMVLHYLVNYARPPVLPNLQMWAEAQNAPVWTVDGWKVHFWSDENAIQDAKQSGAMTSNRDTVGALLKSFFQYYASNQSGFGFFWMKEVISLRTPGGILSKEEKGWTGAKTEVTDSREVRHRYLFAIEDPFEHSHNVARTVTHSGIVAIRDEFRRAWRILGAVGNGQAPSDGGLLDELVEEADQVVETQPATTAQPAGLGAQQQAVPEAQV